jgi:hypothetical protein
MAAASKEDIANAIIQGTEVAASAATIAAPIVSIYNPAVGAAMQVLAPLAEKFIISEAGLIIQFKTMSIEDQKAALAASKF